MKRAPSRYYLARLRSGSFRTSRPYGLWVCPDGREVIFNRDYVPLWQRRDGVVMTADPGEWVTWIVERWFYTDVDLRRRTALARRLDAVATAFHRGEDVTCFCTDREVH